MQTAEWVVSQVIKQGRVVRGYLGIKGTTLEISPLLARKLKLRNTSPVVVRVVEVEKEGPAQLGGVEPEDWILALNGELSDDFI